MTSGAAHTFGAQPRDSQDSLRLKPADLIERVHFVRPFQYVFGGVDCRIDPANTAANGVLDAKKYTRELERSWLFRTVGYGHDADVWKDMISNLRMVGYDHVISIEHEDSLMSGTEGLKKAIAFLKDVVIREQAGVAYWA